MFKKNKIIIIASLAVLALLAIFAAGYLYWKKNQAAAPVSSVGGPDANPTVQAPGTITKAQYDLIKAAGKKKDPSACAGLDQERKDGCLFYVFLADKDAGLCGRILNADLQKQCREIDIYSQALDGQEIKKCLEIENSEIRSQCVEAIARSFDSPARCDVYQEEIKELCVSTVYYEMFLTGPKVEYCDKITTQKYKDSCTARLQKRPLDQDGDGLTDNYETALGTDPFKKDTDRDGVADGDEMKQHRNPLMRGK